jgi:hypothetical protein
MLQEGDQQINNFLEQTINSNLGPGFSTKRTRGLESVDATPKAGANPFTLPSIKQKGNSPFKAFLDTSIVSQKIKQSVVSEANSTSGKAANGEGPIEGLTALNKKFSSTTSKSDPVKMSPKVLETWINETLQDAEHLDIPGVILKPEQKSPITRYGVDRQSLIAGGLSNQMIDRIYRALFVYSVGYYELLKKCL